MDRKIWEKGVAASEKIVSKGSEAEKHLIRSENGEILGNARKETGR